MFGTSQPTPAFPQTTPTVTVDNGIHNDTLLASFNAYYRTTDEGKQQLSTKIDPRVSDEEWNDIPNRVYQVILNPGSDLTVGKLAAHYAQEARFSDAWRDKYDQAREEAMRAIAMIGDRLIQESNDRNWCSEFDGLIDDANENLPGWLQLPVRERDYEVSWTESYTVTVSRSTTVTARNEEHACELVADMGIVGEADDYEMRQAISCGNYECDDDNGDFEACEA